MTDFPDLGSLWMHDRYGLVMFLGLEPYTNPREPQSWDTLYTVYVLLIEQNRRTSGIYAPLDWFDQFTPVGDAHAAKPHT